MSADNQSADSLSEVTVRMYRQGLGDCFLLIFPGPDNRPFYVLIDCGVIKGTENPAQRTRAVAEDIRATTGGHLHVLVATHEHWDHLSGFLQAQDIFQEMQIDTVWLAWTEDATDPLANTLRKQRTDRAAALQAASLRMTTQNTETRERVEDLLEFFGDAATGQTTAAAIQSLPQGKGKDGGARSVRYCRPGEPAIDLIGDDSLRVYVLGPPQDAALIRKSDPTRAGREVYEFRPALTEETALLVAAEHGDHPNDPPSLTDPQSLDDDTRDRLNRSFPFDKCFHLSREEAASGLYGDFFQSCYGLRAGFGEEWRRIDTDWLEATGEMALQLDSDTNNTSLALAFEIGERGTGKVLLFPGDAQVGNWLSWHQYQWPPAQTPITAQTLLARTVLYKVGHHGSHNATLRALGLELMTSPDLVAMIPVSAGMARKKRWAMPFEGLYTTLRQKTQERIMRVDDGWEDDGWKDDGSQGAGQPASAWSLGENNPRWTNLYVEYRISGSQETPPQ